MNLTFFQNLKNKISKSFAVLPFDSECVKTDGTITRLDSVKKGDAAVWLAVHKWEYKGNEYYKAIFGNWREGSQHHFTSYGKDTSTQFKKEEDRAYKTAQTNLEKEKIQKQKACAEKWRPIYGGLPQNSAVHKYLKNKKIESNFNARVTNNGALFIPAWNHDGFVGGQNIFLCPEKKSYDKRFTFGIKILGALCPFGNIKDATTVYIAEGFATAASIWMAVKDNKKTAVATAFNTANLYECGVTVRKFNPKSTIIYAADFDVHNDNKLHNIGAKKAQWAAKKIGNATVRRVKFSEHNAALSDFNDLHTTEGIDAVKKQLAVNNENFCDIIPLGYDRENDYYVYSTEKKLIIPLAPKALSQTRLLSEAPAKYWGQKYNGFVKDDQGNETEKISWPNVVEKFSADIRKAGLFDPNTARSSGVWDDGGSPTVNLGTELWRSGKTLPFYDHGIKTKNIYTMGKTPFAVDMNRTLSKKEAETIIDAFSRLNFYKPNHHLILLGWIAAAQVYQLLDWRPHLWLTGDHGSGKSTVLKYIRQMIPFAQVVSGITAAGLRQSAGRNALATIFDEAEPGNVRERGKISAIIEMVRLSSTKGEAKSLRGTAGGTGLEYNTDNIFCLGSIQIPKLTPADISRFVCLPLSSELASGIQFRDVEDGMQKILPLAPALFARCVTNIKNYKKNIKKFAKFLAPERGMRIADLYAPLIAGVYCLGNDGIVDDSQISAIIDDVVGSKAIASKAKMGENTEAHQCFADILNIPLPQSGVETTGKTIAAQIDLILEAMAESDSALLARSRQEHLLALGMRVDTEKDPQGRTIKTLFISNQNKNLDNVLRRMDSYVDYPRLLKGHKLYLRSDIKRLNRQVVRGKIMDITTDDNGV